MRSGLIVCLGCLFTSNCLLAQNLPQYDFKGPVLYFELGGAGGDYTVNVEHVIGQWRGFKLNGRVGFGIGSFNAYDSYERDFLGIPVGVQAYNKLGSNGHTEFGLCISYLQGRNFGLELPSLTPTNSKTLTLNPSVGYRFQKPVGGIFLRVMYTPGIVLKEFTGISITSNPEGRKFYHWAGVSIGYFFKQKDS